MSAVIVMAARVNLLAKAKAWQSGLGAKLWTDNSDNKAVLSGPVADLFRDIGVAADVSMEDPLAIGVPQLNGHTLPNGGKLLVGDVSQLLPSPQSDFEPKDQDEHGLTVADYLFPAIRFLGAFFENQPNCTSFIQAGGAEFVLDYATLQSLPYGFHGTDPNQELTVLVHMLAETKPHLVIPSIIQRAQSAVDTLSAFWTKPKESGFFTTFTRPSDSKAPMPEPTEAVSHGTFFVKNLNAVLVLTDMLREIYAMPLYQTRSVQQASPFAQVNLADRYCNLITSLGNLQAACVWEAIVNEKNNPDLWTQGKQPTSKPGSDKPMIPGLGTSQNPLEGSTTRPQQEGSSVPEGSNTSTTQEPDAATKKVDEESSAFKNVQTLRYLLGALPLTITGFMHNLGLGLIGKRRGDPYQKAKQNANMVAEAIADSVLYGLQLSAPKSGASSSYRFPYLIVILSQFSHLLYEAGGDRPQPNYLTLVLVAFKRNNGLKVLKEMCEVFMHEVKALEPLDKGVETNKEVAEQIAAAYGGIKIILAIFTELAAGKSIVDSTQTNALTSSHDRDRGRPDYFQPGQFLVDLRMEILPMAQEMWNSEFATQSQSLIVKFLVDILRSSMDGEYETGAAVKSDTPPAVTEVPRKPFVVNKEREAALKEKGFEDADLNKEALYRCNNVLTAAEEYCKAQKWLRAPPRLPPRPTDIQTGTPENASGGEVPDDAGAGDSTPFNSGYLERSAIAMLLAQASGRSNDDSMHTSPDDRDDMDPVMRDSLARALGNVLHDGEAMDSDERAESSHHDLRSSGQNLPEHTSQTQEPVRRRELVTVEDLDAEREKVRSNLIERCLDVLNVHHDVSFELADLISSAIKKHPEPESFRREIGETLVQSLVSLQMENFQTAGKKVAAYAHILALVLQDTEMYKATLEELKDCFSTFLGFIKLPPPEKPANESFPWIGHVLLIIEKLLSDDCQPPQISWNSPNPDDPTDTRDEQPARLEEPLVPLDEKTRLFEALVEILPRVGKDDTLALSVCRILVILTRQRSIAARFGEKRNLQRLFVMVKQLASATNEKLQSSFMLILRHIVEDEATVRQIMRSEIVSNFANKTSRQIDTTGYVRQMYHLVLRAPDIFVEVTNEKLKLSRYESHQRPQALMLKVDPRLSARPGQDQGSGEGTSKNDSATSDASASDDKDKDKSQGKGTEHKAPIVENPDGVIHYLLSELLSYKDVDDKEPAPETSDQSSTDQSENQTQPDVEMSIDEPTPSVTSSADTQPQPNSSRTPAKKGEKPPFNAEEHPIYIYRCFLLQCLTELLSSYNRTKVEFINFSRKADPLATTPSKPRSGILNYLLNVLVPLGTMEHEDSLAFKKRSITSTWTMQVLVALCTKTGEHGGTQRRRADMKVPEEDEPDLAFVRRFVLEHALRSYKDAMASTEPLDAKYSKLMCLADLFDKMLSGYSYSQDAGFPSSTRQLAKTMFEKHFIPALTASVADIDLNFPSSKRVIKYILRPLNKLTQTAVILSEQSDITNLGEGDDDEISSATSVSDMEDDREETPDLFRHSTLGMLEARHDEEESSTEESEGEDDEMYEDEYDDEMDYDEEVVEDDGEVVSDEDEDVEGVGPIEGLPGDAVEVIIDDEDEGDDDEDDDEDDDHSDMEDDDDMFADEITGDHDNESLGEGDEDEWESEEMTEDEEEAEMMNQFEEELADIRQSNHQHSGHRIDDLFRVLNDAAAGGVDDMHGDGLGGDIHDEILDELNDEGGTFESSICFLFPNLLTLYVEEDEEMDEMDDEMDDYDDYDMDHGSEGEMDGNWNPSLFSLTHLFDDLLTMALQDDDLLEPWGWEGDQPPLPRPHHHHRFRGGPPPAWATVTEIMPGRHGGLMPVQPYPRVHRTQMPSRGNDDGTNPLLMRNDGAADSSTQRLGPGGNDPFAGEWGQLENGGRLLAMDSPVSFMNAIMQAIGGDATPGFCVVTRPNGIHVHVDRWQPGKTGSETCLASCSLPSAFSAKP